MDRQKTPRAAGREELDGGQADELIDSTNSQAQANTQATTTPTSKWRPQYKVHPATDVFPMMSDEDLDKLGEDIKANGLRNPIILDSHGTLLDGRNRLEAMERAAIDLKSWNRVTILDGPVAEIFAQNIRRRHLTKSSKLT